ncbi:hypothetical protein M9H77_30725 [Catharanthus roseus]|uniref:Uncharacterized protein n=1 Tax=Catharanthus roseus TaxID=4058 RepID=A0ACC0A0B5_CATRO|nr:hypothetical protein M9H77_30725 [Catharanthus roseus]
MDVVGPARTAFLYKASLVRASRTSSWVSAMSASRPSTRWSRFSMCASTAPMPSSTRVRRDSKLAVRSLDLPLDFGITGSRYSSRPRPCCDDSILVVSDPAT